MPARITLLSDFGVSDTYVGQMKGAILAVSGEAQLVDLTHDVPRQDVEAGAFLLWSAVEPFPAGTIHLAVVDPGVGSARRAIAMRSRRGDLFVGPDNGLLVPAVEKLGGPVATVAIDPARGRPQISTTFHGRDLFGPAAGHLANGVPIERIGTKIEDPLKPFAIELARRADERVDGRVLHVDVYGNLVTNVPSGELPRRFSVEVGPHRIDGAPHEHYRSVPHGAALAIVGSSGLLEICARDDDASAKLGVRRGDPVRVLPVLSVAK